MESDRFVRTAFLFLAICLPTVGQPPAANSPLKWFHSRHPEKSNPHYKDGTHRHAHAHTNYRARKHNKA
jgi:hypothetical protein